MAVSKENLEQFIRDRTLVSIYREEISNSRIQGFILGFSSELLVIQYVYDFTLDGVMVLSSDYVSEVQSDKTDFLQTQLIKDEGLFEKINFDLSSPISNWRSIFETLAKLKRFTVLEAEADDEESVFMLGEVKSIDEYSVSVLQFSGAANWDETVSVMLYKDLTSVQIGNNYANVYERYFKRLN